jgi:hypothetical protein
MDLDKILEQIQTEVSILRQTVSDLNSNLAQKDEVVRELSKSVSDLQTSSAFFRGRISPGFGKTALSIKAEEDIQLGPFFLDSLERYSAGTLTELFGFMVVGRENPDTDNRFPGSQLTLNHQLSTDGTNNRTFFWGSRAPFFSSNTGNKSVSSAGTTLTDTAQNFVANELAGAYINIYDTAGAFQFTRQIASNTATVITIDGTWPASVTGNYIITMPIYLGAADYPWRQLYAGGEDVSSGGTGARRSCYSKHRNLVLKNERLYIDDTIR